MEKYANFESSSALKKRREEVREARQEILSRAEKDYERKQRNEKQRQQNESWMLPSVNSRIEQNPDRIKKAKKSKKSKKHKKERKHRKHKERTEDSGDSEESDDETNEWVVKDVPVVASDIPAIASDVPAIASTKAESSPSKPERDSWMTESDCFVRTFSRSDLRKKKRAETNEIDEEELRKKQQPGHNERELNPYWKDGGTGLPSEEQISSKSKPPSDEKCIGDGGLRWLKQAYERAKQQAEEEGQSLEAVVSERWGSMENLEQQMAEAERKAGRSGDSSRHGQYQRRDHRGGDHRRERTDARWRNLMRAPKSDSEEEYARAFKYPTENDARLCSRTPNWRKKESAQKESVLLSTVTAESPKTKVKSSSESDDSSGELKDERPPSNRSASPVEILTDKQMNELAAKILKAELIGNASLLTQLKTKMEEATKARQAQPSPGQSSQPEVVVLTRTDKKGLSRPLPKQEFPHQHFSGRKQKRQKVETHDKSGVRDKYFADDDKYSLKQLFEREKLETAEDQNAMFSRLSRRGVERTDGDYDIDDVFVSRANERVGEARVEAQDRLKAITEHKRSSAAIENCRFCIDGKNTPKHLIIAIGLKVYLCLPTFQSLTSGHCCIIPMQHVTASTYIDEDVWSEVQVFRKGLTKMFEEQDRDTVFFETCMHMNRYPHMVLHCVPLPKDVGNLAPMYFKKAILESETEWAQNKKLVDLSKKDVRRSIPKGLPYFSVDFGLQGGFAHVIEDEQTFPNYFAQEIVGGMLDLDTNMWRKPKHEKFDEQRKKVLQFAEWWKPYDWTQTLKEQS